VEPEAGAIGTESTGAVRTGAVAGIALIALLLAGAVSALTDGWAPLQNWLTVLHGLNVGDARSASDALVGVRAVDVAALVLSGAAYLGMRPILGAENKAWVAAAAALPFAGVAALVATGHSGRSALMLGGLVLSWRLIKRDRFRLLGWTGVVASGLLFLVDVNSTPSPEPAAGDALAAGYALFVVWLAWLVFRTLRPLPGRPVPLGTHVVGPGGGCRFGGSDTTELFDLPLTSQAEGAPGTYVGVADDSTRFIIDDRTVTLMRWLEAYDEGGTFEVRVEERGRLATMTIDTGARSNGQDPRSEERVRDETG
jgi:hypothetical protein